MKERCSAPQGCDNAATSFDHFTPVCIAKALGWSKAEYNDPENLQPLCQPHHTQKDRPTPAILAQVRFQIKGGMIKFGEHIT